MYCAIIGDLVGSKTIEDRNEIQNSLNNILVKINDKYSEDITSRFMITLGDEFQGLLKTPDNLISIIDTIKFAMHPTRIRFGIGIGDIYTKISNDMPIGADGPAYHNARDAIDSIKMEKNKYQKPQHDIKFFSGEHELLFPDGLINAALSLCYSIEGKWTKNQRNLIVLLKDSEKTQREVAKEVNRDQANIQRGIKRSGYYSYQYVKETIQDTIIKTWRKINDK